MAVGNNHLERKLDYIIGVVDGLRLDMDQMKQDMAQLKLAQVAHGPHLPVSVPGSAPTEGLKGLPPPPYSAGDSQKSVKVKPREYMSEQEVKDIQENCSFEVIFVEDPRYQSLPPLGSFAPVFINRYDQFEVSSTYMDLTRGVFTTPIRGRFKFTFSATFWGQGRMKVAVVFGQKREEFEQYIPEPLRVKLRRTVKEDCDASTEVSLKLTRLCGEIRVAKCRFMGEMIK